MFKNFCIGLVGFVSWSHLVVYIFIFVRIRVISFIAFLRIILYVYCKVFVDVLCSIKCRGNSKSGK